MRGAILPSLIKQNDLPVLYGAKLLEKRTKDHITLLLLLQLVASAALYLKVDRTKADNADQKAVIKRILQCQGHEEHVGVELLTENHRDTRDLVIMNPVHLRLRMECADHPAGTTKKETISTESSLEISITLE